MKEVNIKREYMPDLMKFLNQVEKLRGVADKEGVWVTPPPEDCLAFAVTEAGEAVDAMLRQKPEYTRSHDKKVSLEHELGDMAVMLASYLIQSGLPNDDSYWPPVWRPSSSDMDPLRAIDFALAAWSFDTIENVETAADYYALWSVVAVIAILGNDFLTSHINYLWDKWVSGDRKDDKIVPLAYCPACDWYFPPDTSECNGCHGPTRATYMKQVPMDLGEGV